MKPLKCFLILCAGIVFLFSGCWNDSDSKSDSHTRLVSGFGANLRKSLPEVTPITTKSGSPADADYESYAEAQTYGGLFQRVLGNDPMSIFFNVDMVDQLTEELLYAENPDMRFFGEHTITLPFFGDSITYPETFIYDGIHTFSIILTFGDQSETLTATIDDFLGGYSGDSISVSYHISIPDFAEGTTIYFAERNPQGKLNVRYATFGIEFHEGERPEYYTTNRSNVYFLCNAENDPYTYKSVGKNIRTDNNETGVFSVIMGGVTEEFIIRRRAFFNDGTKDMYIDQLFATTYDASTGHVGKSLLEEQYSIKEFDIDGGGFTGGGLGDTITLTDPDAVHLNIYTSRVAAHEMFDFSESSHLPQTEDDVIPNGWDFE